MQAPTWHAEPLDWGYGPRVLELFLEPTCPFSVRAFNKLDALLAEAFAIPDLDRAIKWHCRYARQNGIHVSPTFMIDGLVQPDMGSGDAVADWVGRLRQA